MRIGLDGIILRSQNAGSLRYFEQLLEGLAHNDPANEYVIFMDSHVLRPDPVFQRSNLFYQEVKPTPFPAALHQQFYTAWHRRGQLDVLHSPVFFPPLSFGGKTITTVFDLAFELYPETTKWTGRLWRKLFARSGIAKADCVITLSQSTKTDLCKWLDIAEEKVKVIYPCSRSIFHPLTDKEPVFAKYKLPEKYILYVGTLEPRKNLVNLIRAFALARQAGAVTHKLVIAGQRGWLYQEIDRAMEQLDLQNDIIFLNFVPDEDLAGLYSGADLFTFPSRYEGFGLPVLEAMACGTPVLTSNCSSLPEVAGDAGVLVSPDDVEGIASQIIKILSDRELRTRLSQQGLRRAAYFSQDRFIQAMLATYKHVCQKGK